MFGAKVLEGNSTVHPPTVREKHSMKNMAPKKRQTTPKPTSSPPLPQNPQKFISKEAEDDYQFLNHTLVVLERGFPPIASNFGNLLQGIQSWNKLCEHPPLGVAQVVREFHTNL